MAICFKAVVIFVVPLGNVEECWHPLLGLIFCPFDFRMSGSSSVVQDADEVEIQRKMNAALERLTSVADRGDDVGGRWRAVVEQLRELLLANRQRSLLVQEHLRETRGHIAGVLEHKSTIVDVITKFAVKRAPVGRPKRD